MDLPEVVVTCVILALLGWSALRHGRANPVSTGGLADDVAALRASITRGLAELRLEMEQERTRLSADHAALATKLKATASAEDIATVRADLLALRRENDLNARAAARTEAGVARIEQWLLNQVQIPR